MLTILGLICVFTIVFYKYAQREKYKDIEKIPGPKPLPIVGNVFDLGSNLLEYFENQNKLVQNYGPVLRIWIGSQLTIMLADPEKISLILGSTEHVHKSKLYQGFRSWLGNGLVSATDINYWAKHRKLITPTLHFKVVKEYAHYINSNSKILIDNWSKRVDMESFDIFPHINLYALDVINEAAMKTKINAQLNQDADYVKAVKGFLRIHIAKVFSLYKSIDVLFNLTKEGREQQKYVKVLRGFTEGVIKSRQEDRKTQNHEEKMVDDFGVKSRKSFLDHLLDLTEVDNVFTDDELREEVDTFMFGGHDTISSAVSFCLMELSKHLDVQQKLVQESVAVMGSDKNAEVNFDDVNQMPYLECVIKECLRMYAPVPFIEREIKSDIMIDGLRIPKGTNIQLLIYAMQRNGRYYSNPEHFDPDRFLPENAKDRHPYAFIPFSAGPRKCIAQRYGFLSVKTMVIRLLRHFEFYPDPQHEPIITNNAILESLNGIFLKVKHRPELRLL